MSGRVRWSGLAKLNHCRLRLSLSRSGVYQGFGPLFQIFSERQKIGADLVIGEISRVLPRTPGKLKQFADARDGWYAGGPFSQAVSLPTGEASIGYPGRRKQHESPASGCVGRGRPDHYPSWRDIPFRGQIHAKHDESISYEIVLSDYLSNMDISSGICTRKFVAKG